MRIEDAPPRVRLEHYRRERRNSIIAVLVLVSLAALVLCGLWKLIT